MRGAARIATDEPTRPALRVTRALALLAIGLACLFARSRPRPSRPCQRAYDELLQETPFSFPSAAPLLEEANLDRTCEPNRGPASAPLFLVNHWVTTDPLPRPSDADAINAYRPLMARLRACERIRDHIPNLVAVNFPRRGDLYRAVDTLNGVR